jgi:PEP-CTERM/exosortase A-associated glycosyltransferase
LFYELFDISHQFWPGNEAAMKILHVLDTSIPDTAGYTTRAKYLVHYQKKQGIEPVILTSERFKGPYRDGRQIMDGVIYYRSVPRNTGIRNIPFLAEWDEINCFSQRVADVASSETVDLIHAHSPSLNAAACLRYCRTRHIPLVYEIRAFWEDAAVDRGAFRQGSVKYRLRRHHETAMVRKADAVIAICTGIKNDLLSRGVLEKKIHVVHNGVDHDRFQPLVQDMALKTGLGLQNKTIIGFVGSFFYFEGLQDLIRAMPCMVKKNKDIELLLVGGGQVEDNLRQLAGEVGIEHAVHFTGRVPHDQVSRYYSIIDLLVYPRIPKRITELVTPLKPLEAMAMEKAVLMSDVGGLRELVTDKESAAFFRAGDVSDLAEKCLALCADSEQRRFMGLRARQNMVSGWGWDRRAAVDIRIYEQLVT